MPHLSLTPLWGPWTPRTCLLGEGRALTPSLPVCHSPPPFNPSFPLPLGSVSFCTFLAHEYPDLVHKVIMINGGGPTALEPSFCSIFNMPTCVLHCLSPCLAWSFLK